MGMFDWFRKRSTDPLEIVRSLSKEVSESRDITSLMSFLKGSPLHHDVIHFHGGNIDDLELFYGSLVRHGAGQWARGYYVPVASLADPKSLDFIYAILNRQDGWDDHNKWLYISATLVEHVAGINQRKMEHAFFGEMNG